MKYLNNYAKHAAIFTTKQTNYCEENPMQLKSREV